MDIHTDKETEKAWGGWLTFTRLMTWGVIAVTVTLGLMALFLL